MRTIHKFPLKLTDDQTIELPDGAKILSVQWQMNGLMLWALVDCHNALTPRHVMIRGTGHDVPDYAVEHISTVITECGGLVWHVFERFPHERK